MSAEALKEAVGWCYENRVVLSFETPGLVELRWKGKGSVVERVAAATIVGAVYQAKSVMEQIAKK